MTAVPAASGVPYPSAAGGGRREEKIAAEMDRPMTTERLGDEPATRRLAGGSGDGPSARATERLDEQHGRRMGHGPIVLDRYRLERRLGAGGHGVVWLAWDERLERDVALKVVPLGEGGPGLERAEREARVAARLNHPGIVALYELGKDEEAVYLVSELVRGATFGELLRGGALSDRDVARIGAALCDALAYAHASGVIHRDVKPGNVIVVAEPAAGAGFAKLTDFGVAHLATGDPLTRTGDVVGTLAYMAPEQAEGRRVTAAADVYSLALTLYEGWTGENPVRAAGPAATARRLGRPLPPVGRRRRDLPSPLCAAIDDALDPDPERRPSPEVLGRELEIGERELSDEGGLVEPGTLERFGLTSAGRSWWRRERAVGAPRSIWTEGTAVGLPERSRLRALGLRLAAGAAAGALLLLAVAWLRPEGSLDGAPPAPLAAGAATLLVALLPRIGWSVVAAGLVAWLASRGAGSAGREGTALVVAGALATVPLLLPRAGHLWSVPALAPLLGAIGLAPLYLAVAGMASTMWRRLGAGAAGFLWLAAAEPLSGRNLLFGPAEGTGPLPAWQGSLGGALDDAYQPFLLSIAPLPLVLWALLAAALPLLVRGRGLALDAGGAAVWGGAVLLGHRALGDIMDGSVALADARGAVAGAVLGALAAVAARAVVASGRPGGGGAFA